MTKKQTQDGEVEEVEQEEVELETEDETSEDQEDETEDEETDEDDSEEESDEDETDEDDEYFEKKFPQLKGDTLEEYTVSLEKAYRNSSTEGQRLKLRVDELEKQLAAGKTEDTETKKTDNADEDPALTHYKQELVKKQKEEYDNFVSELSDKGIELEDEPELAKKLTDAVGVVSATIKATENRIPSMDEALRKAWKIVGKETDDTKDKVKIAAKKVASQSSKTGSAKKVEGKSLTEEQKRVAELMGRDPKKVASFAH